MRAHLIQLWSWIKEKIPKPKLIFPELQEFLLSGDGRNIRNGRLPVGLKIHCSSVEQAEILRTIKWRWNTAFGKFEGAGRIVFPAVGSANAAIHAIELLQKSADLQIFNNPAYQIQVCTAGKFSERALAILGICTYLGSDVISRFDRKGFVYTKEHCVPTSIIIFGAGTLDTAFEYWIRTDSNALKRLSKLPIDEAARADILACSTRKDIRNVNLIGTLLQHAESDNGCWKKMGQQFIADVTQLLREHQLVSLLEVPWAPQKDALGNYSLFNTGLFFDAFEDLSAYALDEVRAFKNALRNEDRDRCERSVLYQLNSLLQHYDSLVIDPHTID